MTWAALPSPFFALAPMEDVTDAVFRNLLIERGRPDLLFTEFVRPDRVLAGKNNHPDTRLLFSPEERPIIAQIWGTRPDEFAAAAGRLEEMGFDGIDINMGCPAKKIRKVGAGAALIGNLALAERIIDACTGATSLPISVKTRIGIEEPITDEWASFLLSKPLAAITVHGRTALHPAERSADWSTVRRFVELKTRLAPEIRIVGNGDVTSRDHGIRLAKETGADGLMVGRAIFHNPFFFHPDYASISHYKPTPLEGIEMVANHSRRCQERWGENRNYEALKKFFRSYINSFPGAPEALKELYKTHSYDELFTLLEELRASLTVRV